MSVSVFSRNKVGTADELTPVATKNNQRVYVGTKKAVEAAMKDGDIGNNSVVYITDDYDDKTVIDTANYAVTAGTANKALKVDAKANTWDFTGGTQLPPNCNMKTIVTPGTYCWRKDNNEGPVDTPSGMRPAGILRVYKSFSDTKDCITQEWTDYKNAGRIARRLTYDNGASWTEWQIFSGFSERSWLDNRYYTSLRWENPKASEYVPQKSFTLPRSGLWFIQITVVGSSNAVSNLTGGLYTTVGNEYMILGRETTTNCGAGFYQTYSQVTWVPEKWKTFDINAFYYTYGGDYLEVGISATQLA